MQTVRIFNRVDRNIYLYKGILPYFCGKVDEFVGLEKIFGKIERRSFVSSFLRVGFFFYNTREELHARLIFIY